MIDDGVFGAEVAATYDTQHAGLAAEIPQITQVLKDLSAGGPILEFAIGTGRIALPLATLGCEVAGIEISGAMVAELRKKETGTAMRVDIGDMTTTDLGTGFALVFLVFNTIDNLTTQDAQIACFENAARHLAPGGRFLIETQVPPVQKIPFGERISVFSNKPDYLGFDDIDVATQLYSSTHVRVENGVTDRFSVPFRYAWPAEMDLMAKLAGMALESRWADWRGSAFSATSTRHISVWQKPG